MMHSLVVRVFPTRFPPSPLPLTENLLIPTTRKIPVSGLPTHQIFIPGCPLIFFILFFHIFSFLFLFIFSWHLNFFHFWSKFSFFHFLTIMRQFCILLIGLPDPFSSVHTALVYRLGNKVCMQHYQLLFALILLLSR